MKPKGPRWNEEEREQGGHWWPFRYTYTHRPPVEATPLSSCWHKTHCVCVCCVSGARWDCESSWACFTCTLTHRGTGLSYKFDLKKHFFISHLSTMEVYVHIHLHIPDYILLLLCHNISRPYWVVQNFACFLIGLIYSEVQSVGVRLVYRPKLLRWPTRGNWRFFFQLQSHVDCACPPHLASVFVTSNLPRGRDTVKLVICLRELYFCSKEKHCVFLCGGSKLWQWLLMLFIRYYWYYYYEVETCAHAPAMSCTSRLWYGAPGPSNLYWGSMGRGESCGTIVPFIY